MSQQLVLLHDTETTGLAKNDEVIQWAAILYSITEGKIKGYFNEYFWTQTPINPEATNVHGINRRNLLDLSKGKTFEVILHTKLSFLRKMFNGTFIAYNESFDYRLINQTLTLQGYEGLDMGPILIGENDLMNLGKRRSRFCLMNYAKRAFDLPKKPSLQSCVPALGLNLVGLRSEFIKQFPQEAKESSPHNALFDSFVMLRIIEELIKSGRSVRSS